MIFLFLVLISTCLASQAENYKSTNETLFKRAKAFTPFQVIKFPNDACVSTSRNGTCYTGDECSSKGGTSSGSCANGFGVCCLFVLSCGGSTSSNNSYLVQGSADTFKTPCSYNICPASNSICRIRLDFNTFNLASPQQGLFVGIGAASSNRGQGIGNCVTDSFVAYGPGFRRSPVICGDNNGQHMILTSTMKGACLTAIFEVGIATTVTRSWDIKVTQYDCAEEMGGPPGCLQFYTGVVNTIQSFNFPLKTTTVTSTYTHLANQNYDICFRRESGYCSYCLLPTITIGINAMSQASFGISVNLLSVGAGITNTCNTDYLTIPGGNTRAEVVFGKSAGISGRFCGRFLNVARAMLANISVCSRSRPFRISFVTTSGESNTGTAVTSEESSPAVTSPSGLVGFQLKATQLLCSATF